MTAPAPHRVDDVLLAEPRGFCAGVDRAIEIVERALALVPDVPERRVAVADVRRVARRLQATRARVPVAAL